MSSLSGKNLIGCRSSRPADVIAAGVIDERSHPTIWIANLTDQNQSVRIAAERKQWQGSILDERSVEAAASGRLDDTVRIDDAAVTLGPFSIARLEAADGNFASGKC
jgi:hypothetical protein